MHDFVTPECSYCQHYVSCFQTDLVVDWGYCKTKKSPSEEDLERAKRLADDEDYRGLLDLAEELGFFVPTAVDCDQFEDDYPF